MNVNANDFGSRKNKNEDILFMNLHKRTLHPFSVCIYICVVVQLCLAPTVCSSTESELHLCVSKSACNKVNFLLVSIMLNQP